MAPLTSRRERPVVLLTNDDGPPSSSSPNLFGWAKLLQQRLGWDIRVVTPDCQKSWVGKAYAISDVIQASYFYPLEPDGLKGEITPYRRALKDGEVMEWVLLSGTPATCSNIAIHNLYPNEIDLVISGPNHGRNSSTAFSLSSGTIGAALGAALAASGPGSSNPTPPIPSIALSYGLVERPCPAGAIELAQEAALEIVASLWNDWGYECTKSAKSRIQVYTINVPLVVRDLQVENRRAVWANMWRTTYGSMFKQTVTAKADYVPGDPGYENKPVTQTSQSADSTSGSTKQAGPNALPTPSHTPFIPTSTSSPSSSSTSQTPLKFKFGPSMEGLLNPKLETLPHGCDAWVFAQGWSSVVPLRAEFGGITTEETWFERESGEKIVPGDEFDVGAARRTLGASVGEGEGVVKQKL